jgi:hypothetical protein
MTINGSKLSVGKITLVAWIVFSVCFVAYSAWGYMGGKVYNSGVKQGQVQAVNALLQQASKCEAFSVYAGENKVELVNVACLEKSE